MKSCPPRLPPTATIVLVLLAQGCASGPAHGPTTPAVPLVEAGPEGAAIRPAADAIDTRPVSAALPVAAVVEDRTLYRPVLTPERFDPLEVRIDEILTSPMFDDPDFDGAVGDWVEYWRVTAAPWFPDYLQGMANFRQSVDSALAVNGLPASLRYLPLIESGYNPRALSRAQAVGLWQFMPATAVGWGMEVTPLIDERRDPVKSTEGAVGFLSDLREDLGSWFLALAAYNSGPSRVRRILERHAPGVEPTDSLFWSLRRHFPRETRNFIPKLVGAALVAGAPHDHGYVEPAPTPFRFDHATVPDATTLDVVARAAEVSQAEIERLNPHFVRGITPPGKASGVRVPEGQGAAFRTNYARIPADERVTFVEHRVVAGETLSHIGRRYGVDAREILAANPGVRARFLRIGSLLTVPVAPSVRTAAADVGS